MIVEHSFEVRSLCPVDGRQDVYACTVRAARVVKVEDILAAAKAFAKRKVYQEELTEELRRALACEVETVGHHSGVRTKVVCA